MAALWVGIEGLEEARGPINIVAIGADSHETERRLAVARGPCSVAPKLGGVLLRVQIAAASLALIPDAPQIDVEGGDVTIGGALCGESIGLGLRGGVRRDIAGGRVAVFDLLVEVPRWK
jgi:hypothetical protein